MEALTTKIESQFKDIKGEMKEMQEGCNNCGGPHPSSECNDKPMGGPNDEEANYAYGANHTYQYPMGIAENMLVHVGKFVFLADFVILQMEEDDKVPLNLGRPFLRTADAIIRVKNKELNLGVRDDRITFLIDKTMRHSHSNDDICFAWMS
ncbi:reverse transcriptase domain-containing protein [Tanacetum coccineum]